MEINKKLSLVQKIAQWRPVRKAFEGFAKNNFIKKTVDKCAMDGSFALKFLLGANCLKDAINCGFYVQQSLNNKNIPEEKRKFVAALDMSNGVLMIASQLALGLGFLSDPVQNKLNKILFGKVGENARNYFENTLSLKTKGLSNRVKVTLRNAVKELPIECKIGFKAISTLVVANIIAKRVVVPFIATPLATYIKEKYMTDNTTKPTQVNKTNTVQNPVALAPAQNANPNTAYTNTRLNSLESYRNFTQKGTMFHY